MTAGMTDSCSERLPFVWRASKSVRLRRSFSRRLVLKTPTRSSVVETLSEKLRLGDARRDGASKFLISRRGRLGDPLKRLRRPLQSKNDSAGNSSV